MGVKNSGVVKDIFKRLYAAFGPQHWWPGDTPFEMSVGAILTQNTNWKNVEKAINNLKKQKLLTAKHVHNIPISDLSELIRPAGYYNVKAKRLKSFVSFLMGVYCGSLKRMKKENAISIREKLLGVHGIGPETADSILLYALERPVFVIDAYTKRVVSRHNILRHDEPYETYRTFFEDALGQDVPVFNEYHALFVRVGKEFCRKKPLCGGCPLNGLRVED